MRYINCTIGANNMKLIVGLGNIGKEYENTRHNVGFMAIDEIAKKNQIYVNKEKNQGLYTTFIKNGETIVLLKPQKYMNLSGEVVKSYLDYFKIEIDDLLVISDDLDLPVGRFRLKSQGSSGGHNGLNNIEYHIKTKEYKRLKIGISNNKEYNTKDYVLGNFSKEEKQKIDEIIHRIPDILDDFIVMKYDNVMNKYNRK